jgi:hypothetical protein
MRKEHRIIGRGQKRRNHSEDLYVDRRITIK